MPATGTAIFVVSPRCWMMLCSGVKRSHDISPLETKENICGVKQQHILDPPKYIHL